VSCADARRSAQAALVPPSSQDAAPCPAAPSANGAAGAPARPAMPQLAALAPGAANLARLLGSGSGRAGAPGGAPGPTGGGEAAEAGGWAERAGLLPGWGMRGVAWALLSDTPGALLDACLPLARGPARPSAQRLQAWRQKAFCRKPRGATGGRGRPRRHLGRECARRAPGACDVGRAPVARGAALMLPRGRQAAGEGPDAGAPGGPKYDMTYSGEKVLDLGFGSAPAVGAAASPLAWPNMRKARRPHARADHPRPGRSAGAGRQAASARVTPGPDPGCAREPAPAAAPPRGRMRARRRAAACRRARAGARGVTSAAARRAQVGAGFWLREGVAERAEALARAQYAGRRDPHDCALLYLALGRRALLQAWPGARRAACASRARRLGAALSQVTLASLFPLHHRLECRAR